MEIDAGCTMIWSASADARQQWQQQQPSKTEAKRERYRNSKSHKYYNKIKHLTKQTAKDTFLWVC